MKVTMTSCAAGPQGIARPGTVLEKTEAEAKDLIERHFARPFDKERDKGALHGFQKASPEEFR